MPHSPTRDTSTTQQAGPSRLWRWFRWGACLFAAAALLTVIVSAAAPYYLRGPNVFGPGSGSLLAAEPSHAVNIRKTPVDLTVMTLNLAHGRAEDIHQALLDRETIAEHLDRIASKLREESPDVVALQEADGPSIWSGRFDHVAYLAKEGGYEQEYRGEHVHGFELSYGTAMLSHYPLEDRASITFAPSPPTFPKGFVVSEVSVPGVGPVTVASVHLDFARESVREEQIERLAEELAKRPRPLIVMGDFNCDWDDEGTLPDLAKQLGLRAYEPDSTMTTFPKLGKRLDWILVSDRVEFVDYQVGDGGLSDHRAVIARLRIRPVDHGIHQPGCYGSTN